MTANTTVDRTAGSLAAPITVSVSRKETHLVDPLTIFVDRGDVEAGNIEPTLSVLS